MPTIKNVIKLRIPKAKIIGVYRDFEVSFYYNKKSYVARKFMGDANIYVDAIEKPHGDQYKVIDQTATAEKLERLLQKPLTVEDLKKIGKEIKTTSTKLPKKTLKLENLNEMTQDDLYKAIKEKLPKAIGLRKFKQNNAVGFGFDGIRFIAYPPDPGFTGEGSFFDRITKHKFPHVETFRKLNSGWLNREESEKARKLIKDLELDLKTLTKKEAIEKTKEIKTTSTKLPKNKNYFY
jgi:hypothetical protein